MTLLKEPRSKRYFFLFMHSVILKYIMYLQRLFPLVGFPRFRSVFQSLEPKSVDGLIFDCTNLQQDFGSLYMKLQPGYS